MRKYIINSQEDWEARKEKILGINQEPRSGKKEPRNYPCVAIVSYLGEGWDEIDFIYLGAYKIKPIEWERAEEEIECHDDIEDKYEASTTFGGYEIELISDEWFINYCFREYYDDGCIGRTHSLSDAKEIAAKHWEDRLSKTLIKIK